MKLNHLAQMLFLLIVLHEKVKKDPEIKKEPCFGTPRGVWACLLTLSLRTTPFASCPNLIVLPNFFPLTLLFRRKYQVH